MGEESGCGHCGLEELLCEDHQKCQLHASVGQLARGLGELGWEQKLGRQMGESQQASREDRRPSENSTCKRLRL